MEQSLVIALRSLDHVLSRRMESAAARRTSYAISGTHIWVIAFLAQHPDQDVYQKDLEAHFGFTRSTASKLINRLESQNLVRRCSVAHDARLKKLVLTERALTLVEQLQRDSVAFEAKLSAGFSPEEKQALLSYIERLKDNLK